ncbi:MAG TPA: hypothetical protein VFE47_25255 [Tepidisphaeraceae bacterium]|jgi:hypothetical protein|nr:hypothetical protein [Tepidisphaeraceae bacterium]
MQCRSFHFLPCAILALLIIPLISLADPPGPKVTQGIFVAVGYGGRRMSSRDGVHWENVQQWADKGEDDSNNLISVAYGKGKFVAVGGGGWSKETQAGHILVSTDGAKWREVKKGPFRISPILFEAGKFVAGGPSRQLLWSEDGENWAESPQVELPKEIPGWAFWFRHGVAGNGIFIFTGNANKDQKTWWSIITRDGKTIDRFASDLPEVKSMAFGAGKFLLASSDAIYTSPDGLSWHKEPAGPADSFRDVVFTGKEFFLSGNKGTYTSSDGATWKPLGKPAPCTVCWSNGSLFIGTGWPGKMLSSTNGQKWERGEQPMPGMGINQVVYGEVK